MKYLPAALVLLAATGPVLARTPSDAEKLRQQAEHVCYDDVQKLCNDAIPDEEKIKACMQAKHSKLSAACAKIYDQGRE